MLSLTVLGTSHIPLSPSPRSKEYAIQTIFALKTYVQSKVADEERITRELEEIRKYRHWEVLGYSGMDELLKAEVNKTEAEIHAVLKEAKAAGPLLPEKHAGPGRGKKTVDIVNGFQGGNHSTYLARRLLRDRPDLFERLEAGEFASVRAEESLAAWREGRVDDDQDDDQEDD